MKRIKIIPAYLVLICTFGLFITSCQKMERPALGDYPEDPPPPPLEIMGASSYWAFDGSLTDTGAIGLEAVSEKISYVPGVTASATVGGEALNIGDKGYLLFTNVPNEYKSPGSITLAFWMNGAGPVTGGAQGLFAIARDGKFWGNLEMFLENNDNGDEAFIKVHMFNKDKDAWIQPKVPDVLNKWSHIAFVYDGATSTATLYVNGEVASQQTFDAAEWGPLEFYDVTGISIGTFAFQTDPSLTNHGPEGWAKSFNGAFDQFRIFTKALSADEVQNLFANKL